MKFTFQKCRRVASIYKHRRKAKGQSRIDNICTHILLAPGHRTKTQRGGGDNTEN
jgi:hypothetical protein